MNVLAMTLSGADYAGLASIVTVPVAVLVFYLRAIRADSAVFREEFRDRFASLEKRVLKVEEEKVSHKNWVQVAMGTRNRQDRMNAQLAELGGKLDATIGIAGGLKRIGDALQRQTEPKHGR